MFNKIRNSFANLGNTAVKHGGGVSSYSYQPHPLKTVTRTPEPTIKTFAPGTKDVEEIAPTAVSADQRAAAAKTTLAKSASKPSEVEELADKKELFADLLENKTYFPRLSTAEKTMVRQELLDIQAVIDQHRTTTIANKTAEKTGLLAAQKTNEREKSRLVSELSASDVAATIRAEHSPVLKGAELAMLTAAVATAARPVNASADNIAHALQILKNLDLESAVRNMDTEAADGAQRLRHLPRLAGAKGSYTKEDENLAWRIAYKLASSDSAEGFKLLKTLQSARPASASGSGAHAAAPTPPQPEDVARIKEAAEHGDILLRTFLRAGQLIVDDLDQQNEQSKKGAESSGFFSIRKRGSSGNKSDPVLLTPQLTPGALLAGARSAIAPDAAAGAAPAPNNSRQSAAEKKEAAEKKAFSGLAGKAIRGVHQNFSEINRTRMLPKTPVEMNWAVNMVRNGFKSENDPRFVFAEKRVEKVDKWIERSAAPTTVLKMVKRHVLPFWKKTPFTALEATRSKDGVDFKLAESGALAHDRAMVTAEKKIAGGIETSLQAHLDRNLAGVRYRLNDVGIASGPSTSTSTARSRDDLTTENQEIIGNAVRYEVMLKWSSKFLWGVSATSLTEAESTEIKDAVYAKFSHANNQDIGFDIRANIDSIVSREASTPVTPDRLEELAERIDLPTEKREKLVAEVKELTHLVKTGEVKHAEVDMKGNRSREALKQDLDEKRTAAMRAIPEIEAKVAELTQQLQALAIPMQTGAPVDDQTSRLQKTIAALSTEADAKRNEVQQFQAELADLDDPTKNKVNAKRSFKRAIAQFFKNAELGSQVTLTGGGSIGLNTGAITSLAQAIMVHDKAAQAVRPRVTLAGNGGKSAVFRMGCPTTGPVAFFGTQPRGDAGAGVGASFVLDTGSELLNGKGFGLSAGADVGLGMDYTGARGVALAVPRLTTGVVREKEGTDQMARTLATVLGESDATQPAADRAAEMSKLKQVLQQHNNTSVAVIGKSRETGVSGTLSGNVSAGLTGFGDDDLNLQLGVSASLAAQYRRYGQQHQDATGFLKTRMSLKQGSRTTVTAGGNLNIGRGGSDPFINAPGTGGIDLTGAGSNLAGIRADIYKKGSFIRSTMTSLDGEVSPRSFRFITYANAADFEKAVNANIGVWAHRMAKRAHRTEYDAGGERRKAVIEATLQRIDAFVKDAVNRADPKEEFSQYLELSEPAVKKINHLQGMADFMRQAGDKKQAEKLEREITRTFEAADSWEESFLVLGERSSAQESTGLHTGVRWTATLAKIQSKLHVFV